LTVGILEVREVSGRTVKARVVHSCDEVQLGDQVAALTVTPLPSEPASIPASRNLEGVILAAARSEQLIGQQQLVFVDVGAAQGIHQGDVLAIYRPLASAWGPGNVSFPLPPERLGEAVVIRVSQNAATAVLTATQKEGRSGDRVVLSREVKP
jgi:hypothetical protein